MTRLRLASILLVLVGCGEVLAGGLLTALPARHIAPAQQTLQQIRAYSPPVANWVLHASLDETWGLLLVGVATAAIAYNVFPRRERWSWYTLAALSVGYNVGSILIHNLTIEWYIMRQDPAYWSLFVGLGASIVALTISMREFFGPRTT